MKDNRITQYIPPFVTVPYLFDYPFSSLEALMEIPFVKAFSEDKFFEKFVVSGDSLMAIYEGGCKWEVVGTLEDSDIGLPEWEGPTRAVSESK